MFHVSKIQAQMHANVGINHCWFLFYIRLYECDLSSNINEVIRAILNLFIIIIIFLQEDFRHTKSTKSTKRPKTTKSIKSTKSRKSVKSTKSVKSIKSIKSTKRPNKRLSSSQNFFMPIKMLSFSFRLPVCFLCFLCV